jgi:hypothetical protein
VRITATAFLAATFAVVACHRAFVDRARCAQDLRDYEDRLRVERDTVKQSKLIAEADSDAALAGRSVQQRMVIHNLLAYSARSGMAPRGARSGRIAEFVCADSTQ